MERTSDGAASPRKSPPNERARERAHESAAPRRVPPSRGSHGLSLAMSTANTWLAGVTLPRPASDWTDRSLIAFAGPQGEGLPPSITMSRDERATPADPVGES